MIYLIIITFVLVCDIVLKDYIESKPQSFFPKFIKDKKENTIISIERFHNKGLVLGKCKKFPLVILFAHTFILFVFIYKFISSIFKKDNFLVKIGYAFIIGGGISNLYDRYIRRYVVDYIIFNIRFLRDLIVNIGDIAIFFGVIFRFLGGIFFWKRK